MAEFDLIPASYRAARRLRRTMAAVVVLYALMMIGVGAAIADVRGELDDKRRLLARGEANEDLAGLTLDEAGERVFNRVVKVANGVLTCCEALNEHQLSVSRFGPSV